MKEIIIKESGMAFGPFAPERCLHIEKSDTYCRIQQHVKMVEFILLKQENCLFFVEAKQSSPQPSSVNFTDYLSDIRDKFANGLSLLIAMHLKRHQDADLPESIAQSDLAQLKFMFILVINGHEKEWLPPLSDALNKQLRAVLRVWAIAQPSLAVLNDQQARARGLIS